MEAITTSYIAAFLLGLFSTVHCIAMCGSVIGALTLSLPKEVRENPTKMFPYVLNYNLGRLLSYGTAGFVVGLLLTPINEFGGHTILRYVSTIVMIAMGLYLAGWFPKFAKMERLGAPVWKWLQPFGQKLLPVRNYSQAFFLGAVWGWLPCGLVYSALAIAATMGEPVSASLVMLAFGAGTLPAVMGAGIFTGFLAALSRSKSLRQVAGVSIIAMAIVAFFWPMEHHNHTDHVHEQQAHEGHVHQAESGEAK